jgi:hypothetical protein
MKWSIMLILALQGFERLVADTALEVVMDLVVTCQSEGSSEGNLADEAWEIVRQVVMVLQLALMSEGKFAISADPCSVMSRVTAVIVDSFAVFKVFLAR